MRTQNSIGNRPGFVYDLARDRTSSFLTAYRYLFGFLLILLLALTQGILCPCTHADPFPGKGSRETWQKANQAYNAGNYLSDSGKYGEAVLKYKQAISAYPYDSKYFHNLGFSYEQDAKPTLAEAAYRNSLKLDRTGWDSWDGLKNVLYKQERYSESKEACLKALSCNPPTPVKAELERALLRLDQKILGARSTSGARP